MVSMEPTLPGMDPLLMQPAGMFQDPMKARMDQIRLLRSKMFSDTFGGQGEEEIDPERMGIEARKTGGPVRANLHPHGGRGLGEFDQNQDNLIMEKAAKGSIDPVSLLPEAATSRMVREQLAHLAKKPEEFPGFGGARQAELMKQYFAAKRSGNPEALAQATQAVNTFKNELNALRSQKTGQQIKGGAGDIESPLYLTNEAGTESFVPKGSTTPQAIPGGPGVRAFPVDGQVIPAGQTAQLWASGEVTDPAGAMKGHSMGGQTGNSLAPSWEDQSSWTWGGGQNSSMPNLSPNNGAPTELGAAKGAVGAVSEGPNFPEIDKELSGLSTKLTGMQAGLKPNTPGTMNLINQAEGRAGDITGKTAQMMGDLNAEEAANNLLLGTLNQENQIQDNPEGSILPPGFGGGNFFSDAQAKRMGINATPIPRLAARPQRRMF